MLAKRCYCASSPQGSKGSSTRPTPPTFFCPADLNLCVVSRDGASSADPYNGSSVPFHPQCFHTSRRHKSISVLWPITLVLFVLWFLVSWCTYSGRNAWDYALNLIFPCWNRSVTVPVMMWRNPDRANRLIRLFCAAREGSSSSSSPPPTKLQVSLRTTVYRVKEVEADESTAATGDTADKVGKSSGDDSDSGDAAQSSEDTSSSLELGDGALCSICLVPLQTGDRVGSLPCDHAFHVSCLKTWLLRRNVCPLCLHPDVADVKVVAG